MSGFYWHHRTIRHYYKDAGNEEDAYYTVHEFTHDEGDTQYNGWSFQPQTPVSKRECEMMLAAYDLPPVMQVDDAKQKVDEYGFPNWEEYEWLDNQVRKVGEA